MQHSGFTHVLDVSKQCFNWYSHDWACMIRMLDDAWYAWFAVPKCRHNTGVLQENSFLLQWSSYSHVYISRFRVYMDQRSVCSKCFIYFNRTLQLFYLSVAKLDLDVGLFSEEERASVGAVTPRCYASI